MSAFTVQVIETILVLVKVYTPFYKFSYLRRSHAHHLVHSRWVRYVIAGYHGVVYVLLKVINNDVGDRCYTALCACCVGFVKGGLTY